MITQWLQSFSPSRTAHSGEEGEFQDVRCESYGNHDRGNYKFKLDLTTYTAKFFIIVIRLIVIRLEKFSSHLLLLSMPQLYIKRIPPTWIGSYDDAGFTIYSLLVWSWSQRESRKWFKVSTSRTARQLEWQPHYYLNQIKSCNHCIAAARTFYIPQGAWHKF